MGGNCTPVSGSGGARGATAPLSVGTGGNCTPSPCWLRGHWGGRDTGVMGDRHPRGSAGMGCWGGGTGGDAGEHWRVLGGSGSKGNGGGMGVADPLGGVGVLSPPPPPRGCPSDTPPPCQACVRTGRAGTPTSRWRMPGRPCSRLTTGWASPRYWEHWEYWEGSASPWHGGAGARGACGKGCGVLVSPRIGGWGVAEGSQGCPWTWWGGMSLGIEGPWGYRGASLSMGVSLGVSGGPWAWRRP